MEHSILVPVSLQNSKSLNTQSITTHDFPKYQNEFVVPNWVDKRDFLKKLYAKADCLVDIFLICLRIKLSNSLTFMNDGVETWVFVLDSAQQLPRKITDVLDIYVTFFDAAETSPTFVLNLYAQTIEKGSWVPFRNLNRRSFKRCTHKVRLVMDLCANYQRLAICQYQRWDSF